MTAPGSTTPEPAGEKRQHDISVDSAGNVAIGEHAAIYQIHGNADAALASVIRAREYQALIEERTRMFVGRDYVFDAIDRVVEGGDFASGYVLIRGEPGIGKTAIAAQLVKQRGYVHHFNIAPQNIRSPKDFLLSVCSQLILMYRLDHSILPPDAGENSGFLAQVLAESAEAAKSLGRQSVVVVVDALDEAEDVGLPPDVNRLYLPRALPAGVFFVVTTREERDERLDVDNAEVIWLREDDPDNVRDIQTYIERFIDEHADVMPSRIAEWRLGPEQFAVSIAGLSEGNFMYLVYVLPDIARGRLAPDTVGEVGQLPRGLTGYYQRHWRDMKSADPGRFEHAQRPVLCFLAISREPVTVEQLIAWTGLDPGTIRDVMREWREFLNEDDLDGAPHFRLYHRSFADFLDKEESLRWYHEQIAVKALAKIPGFLDEPSHDA